MAALRRLATRALIVASIVHATTLLASDPAREQKLHQGIDLVEKNDLTAAAAVFADVARSPDPALAAEALLRLADVQRRQKKLDDARRTYRAILERFSTQRELVQVARERLARLETPPPGNTPRTWRVAAGDDANPGAHFTPDGRLMSREDRSGDIVVRDMRTGNAERLRAKKDTLEISPDRAELPMISPDGKKIVFMWVFRDDRKGTTRYQLKVMPNVAGASASVLIDAPEPYTYYEPIGWSQDGQSVVVAAWKTDGTSEFAWVSLRKPSLEVVKSMGRRLVLGRSRPRLSPDGTYLAYAALPGDPRTALEMQAALVGPMHLYLLPLGGGGEIELVKNSVNESPVWTPDGRRILFVSNRSDEGYSLWSVGIDRLDWLDVSEVPTRIQGRIRPIAMTRGGTLYYVPEPGGGFDVFLADVDSASGRVSGRSVRLVDARNNRNLAPSWSPDGQRVAFKRRRNAGEVPRALERVEVVVVRSGEEERTYEFEGLDDGPALWLGSRHLLVRRVNGRLFQLDLDRGTLQPIEQVAHSTLPPECGTHALSPDGRTLYLSVLDPIPPGTADGTVSARRRIVAFDVATGDQRDILPPQPFLTLSVLAVAPDGRSLAVSLMTEGAKAPRLALVSVDGTIRELPTAILPRAVSWTRAGLFAARGDTERSEIVRVSLPEGTVAPTGLAHAPGLSFDISRDGLRVVYGDLTGSNVRELWGYENLLARAQQVN